MKWSSNQRIIFINYLLLAIHPVAALKTSVSVAGDDHYRRPITSKPASLTAVYHSSNV